MKRIRSEKLTELNKAITWKVREYAVNRDLTVWFNIFLGFYWFVHKLCDSHSVLRLGAYNLLRSLHSFTSENNRIVIEKSVLKKNRNCNKVCFISGLFWNVNLLITPLSFLRLWGSSHILPCSVIHFSVVAMGSFMPSIIGTL